MNNFGYLFFIVFGTISILGQLYFIITNGIKTSDLTLENIEHLKLQYGAVSLFYLIIESICIVYIFTYN